MADKDIYREFSRRQHRILANYLMIRCWKAGADFVVIPRDALEKWLNISRFEDTRKNWLKSDISAWFPHSQFLNYTKQPSKFAGLYASRKEFDHPLFGEPLTHEARIQKLSQVGKIGVLIDSALVMSEADIAKEFALIAAGLSDLGFLEPKSK